MLDLRVNVIRGVSIYRLLEICFILVNILVRCISIFDFDCYSEF